MNLSAAGPCAQATQAQAHRGLGRAMGRGAVGRGSGLPCGQRAACKSTGDGRERGRRPCLRAPPHSPADAGLFVGRRSATAAVRAPGLRWHTGGRGRVRLRHGASQPGFRRSVQRCGLSRPRPRPPVCQRLQGYRAARCPHGSPSLARPTAPLPMALPLWGRALAWLVRTVGGSDGVCGSHRARVGRDGSRAPDNRRRPAGRPRRARMPL